MATPKKTSTKAKTKTTKAKTTTKKTTAKKTTPVKATASKAATKSAVAKKPVAANATKKPRPITVQRLKSLHTIALGLFLLLGAAAALLMANTSYQLTIGHVAKDELSGALVPAVQSIYDVELRWLVVTTMLVSAAFPALYVTRLKSKYAEYVNDTHVQPWRWIEFAVSGALMVETAALVSGTSDVPTLKLVAGLVVATGLLGLIAERQNKTTAKSGHFAFYTSLFTGLLPWAFILAYAVASVIYGSVADWYIYALYVAVLGGFILHARNLRAQLKGANYLVTERNYVVIGMLTKAAFAAVLITGLFR